MNYVISKINRDGLPLYRVLLQGYRPVYTESHDDAQWIAETGRLPIEKATRPADWVSYAQSSNWEKLPDVSGGYTATPVRVDCQMQGDFTVNHWWNKVHAEDAPKQTSYTPTSLVEENAALKRDITLLAKAFRENQLKELSNVVSEYTLKELTK